jgi:hypothetical protein
MQGGELSPVSQWYRFVEFAGPGQLAALSSASLRVDPVMTAGKVGPVAGLPQAHHLGRDVFVAYEALRDGPIPVGRRGSPVAGGLKADLKAVNLLAPDHAGKRVRRRAKTRRTALRTFDPAKPDLDALSFGPDTKRVPIDDADHRTQIAFRALR